MTRRFLAAVTYAASASVAAAQSPAIPASPAPPASPAAAPAAAPAPSPAPLPYTPATPDPARGAALLKKAVVAHGGAAAIDAIQRLELRGVSGRTMAGQDPIEMASHTHMVIPSLYRNELVTQAGPIATLLNRDGAFVILNGGALPLPETEAVALRATANRNLMVLLRTRDPKDMHVARVGSASLPEGALEMVEFELSGQKTVLGIDPATGLVRQSIYTMPMAGSESRVVATYSDYRPLSNGAKYPFLSRGTVDGKPVFSSRLEAVVVNGTIDDALFTLPSPPPAPAEPLPWASPSPSGH
jgi:hypothetical protein